MAKKGERKRSTERLEKVHRARMENLRRLGASFPTIREFCVLIGQGPPLYTSIAGPNPTRTMGEALARDIECRLRLSEGWLDEDRGPA